MMSTPLPRFRTQRGIAFYRSAVSADGAPPIVLVHGVGLRAESWLRQIPDLEKSRTVYALDMPGHGESQGLACAEPGLGDFANSVAAFVEENVGGPVVVIGHSLGALVALELASCRPDLCCGLGALSAVYQRPPQARAAVMERAAALSRQSPDELDDHADATVRRWFGGDPAAREAELARLCRAWLLGGGRAGYAAAYRIFANEGGPSDALLAGLAMPALFLTGEGDPNSTPAMSRAMAALARKGEAVVIGNARHMVQMTHHDEVNAALGSFIAMCHNAPRVRTASGSA